MSAYLFYGAILSFVLGVGVQTVAPLSLTFALWVGLLAGALSLVWWTQSPRQVTSLLILGAVFFVGVLRVEVAAQNWERLPPLVDVGSTTTLTGTIVAEPDTRASSQQLTLALPAGQQVLVSAERYVPLSYGDVVEVTGRLVEPEAFTTDLGREFNYPGYLRAQGVGYRMSFAQVTLVESGQGHPVMTGLLAVKATFMAALEEVIPEPQAGLGEGLLLGVKQALGDELETAFRKTGIIHIVVLSGYNVMLVVAFVTTILAFFFSLWTRTIIGVLAIVAFALLVGLSATVVRASIMAVLVILAPVLGREYNVLRALCFAGVVMLFLNPYLLVYDVGFQLSFMATLGLIVVAPHFETMLMQAPTTLKVKEFMIATVATQIAVSPLLLYQIGEFSIVSVAVNMLVLPMVAVAMLFTFITGLIALVWTELALLAAIPAYWSLTYIIVLAEWFADWRFAAVLVPSFSFWWVIASYLVMTALLYWLQHRTPAPTVYRPKDTRSLFDIVRAIYTRLTTADTTATPPIEWTVEDESIVRAQVGHLSVPSRPGPRSHNAQSKSTDKTDTPIFFR